LKSWVRLVLGNEESERNWDRLVRLSHLYKSPKFNPELPLVLIKREEDHFLRSVDFEFEFYTPLWVRDHFFTYTTLNARVTAGMRANTAVDFDVDWVKDGAEYEILENAQSMSFEIYSKLLNEREPGTFCSQDDGHKIQPQRARGALPSSAMCRYTLVLNYLTLVHIFKQRLWAPGAQPLTQAIVQSMWDQVHDCDTHGVWDAIYETHGPHAYQWKLLLKRLRKNQITVEEWLKKGVNEKDELWQALLQSPEAKIKDSWN
jgi:hypothetical protein